jgi:fimbrial chaperone protein
MLRVILLAAACLAAPAHAAEFSVSPIRVELPRGVRSAAVSVANEDERPLRMQLRLMEWTQDGEGKDLYRESDELIYYPRLMSVPPRDKRLVRVGVKAPAGAAERTYRLYIDELPGVGDDALRPAASGVSFTIRFALPVFVPPLEPNLRGAIDSITLQDGKLRVVVRNPGNLSFRIASVTARGEAFAAEVGGWYLLAGVTRVHTLDIPAAACRRLRRLDVTVKADKLSLEGGLDVDAGMCPR